MEVQVVMGMKVTKPERMGGAWAPPDIILVIAEKVGDVVYVHRPVSFGIRSTCTAKGAVKNQGSGLSSCPDHSYQRRLDVEMP